MPLKDTDHQLIDKFLRGQLDATEQKLFNEKQGDVDFQKELTWRSNSLAVIKKSGRQDLKKKLQLLDKKMEAEKSTAPQSGKVVHINRSIWLSIAATFLILMGMFWWWNMQATNSEDIFAQNFEPYPNVVAPIVKSDAQELTEAELAFQTYEKKNYSQAIPLLEKINTPEGKFYLGLTHLAQGNTSNAIAILKPISEQSSHRFYQASQWYLALAFFKNKEVDKANGLVNLIRQNPEHQFYKLADGL